MRMLSSVLALLGLSSCVGEPEAVPAARVAPAAEQGASSPSARGVAGFVAADRPNILVLVLDDVGLDAQACYALPGASYAPQPTMQALCARGLVFDRAWANPLCSATRAGMLTGRYANRTGVGAATGGGSPGLSTEERILPAALDAAGTGYVSAAFGKWHLVDVVSDADNYHPNLMGFSHYAGSVGASVPSYMSYARTEDGVTGTSETYATTATVDDALSWVGAQEDPWFMWVGFNAAHRPFHVPPAELHSYTDLPDEPSYIDLFPLDYFQASIEAMDTEIGRLLAGIPYEELQNTWIVVVGDNGSESRVNQHVYPGGHAKSSLYQGGVQVPLIVVGPDLAWPGRRETALVGTVDLFATVLELAGTSVAEAVPAGTPIDSVSLLPYLLDRRIPDQRTTVVTELFGPQIDEAQGGQAVTDGRFKYIRRLDGSEELFDLRNDPGELRNLMGGPMSGRLMATLGRLELVLDAMPLDLDPPDTGGTDTGGTDTGG